MKLLGAASALALLGAIGAADAQTQQQQGQEQGPAVIQGEAGRTQTSAPEATGQGAAAQEGQTATGATAGGQQGDDCPPGQVCPGGAAGQQGTAGTTIERAGEGQEGEAAPAEPATIEEQGG